MPQPSYNTAAANPVSVISSQFIVPYSIDLVVNRTGSFIFVTDINDNIMLKVQSRDSSFHYQRLVLDPHGKPLVMLREKGRSGHSRWQAFRGGSIDSMDLIFSTKTPHTLQFTSKVNVHLVNNTKEDYSDFRIEGKLSKKGCTVYAGDSNSTIIAQLHKKHSSGIVLGKEKFILTVYPNVDYAFVVALIAVLDGMKQIDTAITEGITGGITDGVVSAVFG